MKNCIRYLVFTIVALTWSASMAQDVVILRTGDELKGKVLQVSQTEVKLEPKNGTIFSKSSNVVTINPSDIYLIKYKERGNLYFKENGQRLSGEKQKLDRSADIIYLCEGKEIQAWDLKRDTEHITFRTTKEPKKAVSSTASVDNSAVFMIKYSDGSRDVVSDISANKPQEDLQSQDAKTSEPQIKVVFYTVKPGDTLLKIAENYGVSVDDLRSWNEIGASVKDNARLKPGVQYMIQEKISQ